MSTITVQEIQKSPLSFLGRIEAGEVLVVVRGEEALAEIRPVVPTHFQERPYGLCKGAFTVPEDFNHPLPVGVLEAFESL